LDAFESDEALWRIPTRIYFEDYTDDELHQILVGMLKKRCLKVEGGFEGPTLWTFVRRIGRGRGKASYGNIRTLQTELARACLRQAKRLKQVSEEVTEDESGTSNNCEDYFILTRVDLLGPEPSDIDIRKSSVAWKKLQAMVGLEKVKEELEELLLRAKTNYEREMQGMEPIQTSLHRVFLGPPGTGKSTIAVLYGQLLTEMGLLSSSDVVLKKPTDFLGEYIGQSEANTKRILESTWGKVLIIDEAHMLHQSTAFGTNDSDCYRCGIIDSIVSHVDSNPFDDHCIILIGYPDQMEELFVNSNPGLKRRFPLGEAFIFEDYDDITLGRILDSKLSRDQISVTDEAKKVAHEALSRARDRPNFGNGGEVENLLSRAKASRQKRVRLLTKQNGLDSDSQAGLGIDIVLEAEDFDPDYNRGSDATGSCKSLFKNLVGFDETIERFEGYQKMAAGMRLHDVDPRLYIPFTYVFNGPPGTGKTTTARAMGKIFYAMGFLSKPEVVECSATDMIGEYIGQTGPKVISLLDRALGKVLFIDEAYRLADGNGSNDYHGEAVGELVDCLTKKRYARKLIVVLAGYTEDMDRLMRVNQGLRSRFEADIVFPHLTPEHCLLLLDQLIGKLGIKITAPRDSRAKSTMFSLFAQLSQIAGWANGRDVETLSREIIGHVFKNQGMQGGQLTVSRDEMLEFVREIYRKRAKEDF
jgi:AAA+ superfamily predicted ATPase